MGKTIFIVFFLTLSLSIAHSQINIKVGYTGGWSSLSTTNDLFSQYNDAHPDIEDGFGRIHFLHGLELGARYKIGVWGFDGGVSYISGRTAATGDIESKWTVDVTNYHLGIENYFGMFGYGANIGYQRLRYKKYESGNKSTIANPYQWVSKVYLIFEGEGESTSISIRPYISIPWAQYDISAVGKTLLDSDASFSENSMIFGISILFVNGPK